MTSDPDTALMGLAPTRYYPAVRALLFLLAKPLLLVIALIFNLFILCRFFQSPHLVGVAQKDRLLSDPLAFSTKGLHFNRESGLLCRRRGD